MEIINVNNVKKSETELFVTSDYEIFSLLKFNRVIDRPNLRTIKRSIKANGYFKSSIIIVGSDGNVYDGQHRIHVLKELYRETGVQYEMTFLIDDSFKNNPLQIIDIQIGKKWGLADIEHYYAANNVDLYVALKDFREKCNLPVLVGCALFFKCASTGKGFNYKFKYNKFNKSDYDHGDAMQYYKYLKQIHMVYPHAFKRNFVFAMVGFWNHPDFSHDEFMTKLTNFRTKLYHVPTVTEYKKVIVDLYNYHRSAKSKIVITTK